jgi:hypothetical protein
MPSSLLINYNPMKKHFIKKEKKNPMKKKKKKA